MRQHLPDLVLLDLMLPDMNGWTLPRARERELESAPVLVISAAGASGLLEAQETGVPVCWVGYLELSLDRVLQPAYRPSPFRRAFGYAGSRRRDQFESARFARDAATVNDVLDAGRPRPLSRDQGSHRTHGPRYRAGTHPS